MTLLLLHPTPRCTTGWSIVEEQGAIPLQRKYWRANIYRFAPNNSGRVEKNQSKKKITLWYTDDFRASKKSQLC